MAFDPQAARQRNAAVLRDAGYNVETWLPTYFEETPTLRSTAEIQGRLAGLNALFIYLTTPDSMFATDLLQSQISTNQIEGHFTPTELAIMKMDRQAATEQCGAFAGTFLEINVALSWVLGAPRVPGVDGKMPDGDAIRSIVLAPKIGDAKAYSQWAASSNPRSVEEIAEVQDRFYLSHHFVRSAWLSPSNSRMLPPGFDARSNGAAVQLRRHALTWVLAPEDSWDDTDLST